MTLSPNSITAIGAGRDRTGPVKGTAENQSPEEEPEALALGANLRGEDSNYSRFSSLHHSLRERTGEGPVSSVPAATAVGWDWWKKHLSNLPLAR
ncbi:hypothetical protein AAFF_G00409640 [Aldrovandia affinis]|uniref:Uncharacterized protein n=1 Tax=Aldrovandia affinis TaxID=143900 RepID=A0AAD7WJW7_9TELE|nr:hypothetical protein AAFF_G00409640 [Aldrovandia affinis]